jgi:SNF2 family DNA or RNA helicase
MRNKSGWRLLLTGTPLQNNLQELVVCLDFPYLCMSLVLTGVVPHEFYLA